MSSISEDLYLQILIRVPVKFTFVCKCVCKNWLDLISSPKFIKMHLDFNIQKNNYNLMLNEFSEFSQDYELHSISYNSLSVASVNEFQDGVVNMNYPFISEDHDVALKSSCDGLVCLGFHDGSDFFLCLWNPATNEYLELPEPPREDANECEHSYLLDLFSIYALGYDYKIDDYKLVKVLMGGRDSLIYIYTLGSNSWESIQTIPYKCTINTGSAGDIIGGAAHWLVETPTNSKAIVSFDISEQRLEELQLPEEPLIKKQTFTLGKWDESLCLLVNVDNNIQFDVWVMQEYRVQDSWSKHISVTLRSVAKDSFLRLMWSFKNGKILLKTSGDLVLYDPTNASPSETYICCRRLVPGVENYVESLVSLNSGTYVGR